MLDQAGAGNVVGVKNQDDFGFHQFHRIFQRGCLAAFSRDAMERPDASGKPSDKFVDDFASAVGRTVVDRNDQHLFFRIFHRHQRAENVGDDFLFVVGGDQDSDWRPIGGIDVDVGVPLESEETVQREPIMAGGVDADEGDDDVQGIDHDAPLPFCRRTVPGRNPLTAGGRGFCSLHRNRFCAAAARCVAAV